jgi:myo-inositol-1(or 4)-monophosphatase
MSPLHPVIEATAAAAFKAYADACAAYDRIELAETVAQGADGTPTMRVDEIVEAAVVDAMKPYNVNLLSEEVGFVDCGSSLTLVVDPVDGSANAAAGVPLACFAAALADGTTFTESLTVWLETGQRWAARRGEPSPFLTSGRTELDGAAVSMLRPHTRNRDAWWRVAERAGRVRVLSCSTIDAAFVAQGSVDAFVDAASDSHRLVDLAAAVVLVEGAGGVVVNADGGPVELDTDLTRRWSGVVAATPELADELCSAIAGP